MSEPNKNEFYIGYLDKMPPGYSALFRKFLPVLFVGLLTVTFVLVKFQKGFSTANFEVGKLTEVSGVLSLNPVPMLTLDESRESILLIGYGKFGASGALIQAMSSNYDESILYQVDLIGTLIYHDGKTLLELTRKARSVVSWEIIGTTKRTPAKLGPIALRGEIIDPKCYFGAMKPGEGKPHRSCAIRCISGGIPPMLKVSNATGEANYFILRGKNGQAINDLVLEYVAEPVEVSGEGWQYNNWMILNLNESAGIKPLL